MTDTYPNAPASHSALFDNAPAVSATIGIALPTVTTTAVPPAVPAHLIPATRISMVKGGKWVAVPVLMQYGAPIPLDLALRRVEMGRTVFVAREDVDAVMEAVGDCGTQG